VSRLIVDFGFQNPATGGNTVTILAGETVSFSYPEGRNYHNVVFADVRPSSCTPELPDAPSEAGWQSTCRFDAPGTYAFVCGAHPDVTGAVVVTGTA
jgi:plastocyanin